MNEKVAKRPKISMDISDDIGLRFTDMSGFVESSLKGNHQFKQEITYTRQVNQKNKRFQDGVLLVQSLKLFVFDSDDTQIASACLSHCPSVVDKWNTAVLENKELTIGKPFVSILVHVAPLRCI